MKKMKVVISNQENNVLGIYTNDSIIFEEVIRVMVEYEEDHNTIISFCIDWVTYGTDCLEQYGYHYKEIYPNDYLKG